MIPSTPRSPTLARFLPGLAPFLLSLPGLLHLTDPPARDQGVFATIAWQWLQGATPYLDAGVEHKGPLVLAAYAAAFRLFGAEMWAARFFGWLAQLATALLVTAVARRLPGGTARGAALAGGLYALLVQLSGLAGWWNGAQAETFMEPFLALAVLLLLPPTNRRRMLLGGASAGVALLGKPTALLVLLVVPGVPLLPLIAGMALPLLATALALGAAGALGAAWDQVVGVNLDYGRQGLLGLPERGRLFVVNLLKIVPWPWWIPAAAGFGWGGVARRWLLAALAMIVIQGRFFPYHFHPLAAPASLLVAAGWERLDARLPLFARPVLLLAIVGGLAFFPLGELAWRLERARGRVTPAAEAAFLSPPGSGNDVDPAETAAAAAWLRGHSAPEQTVLVWGFEPAVNFLARRRSPTRFLYDYHLTSPDIPPRRQEGYWQQFRADLAGRPADWIVVVHNDVNPVEARDSAGQLRREPELRRLLQDQYLRIDAVGDFEFFQRRP